ncbi:hypothetical protein HOV72_016215 [Bacillus albus]|nr:hypothetical protein [Bacillus albus]MDC6157436.1 hypothetical protein [Bacillus albus]MDD8006913.1 hypothetical protein [Bacillus albus]
MILNLIYRDDGTIKLNNANQ